jgi:ribosomal protein S18 acetylase RimI-like enzyme
MKIKIIKAGKKHIKDVGILFDLYRQFYKYESVLEGSTKYIKDRISKRESTIFISYCEYEAAGFVQLYETFDSLNINKKLVLYDLYVKKTFRKKGVGKLLMNQAKKFAIKKRIKIIELSTAVTNKKAQSLYESLKYKRDKEYYNYYLEL